MAGLALIYCANGYCTRRDSSKVCINRTITSWCMPIRPSRSPRVPPVRPRARARIVGATRTLADAPCASRMVTLVLRVRRFFCDAGPCPRKIFAERWAPEVLPYARRTARLTDMLRAVAFAAGGHGGARLAAMLRMPTSMRTLLHLMHPHVLPALPAPRAVGIND